MPFPMMIRREDMVSTIANKAPQFAGYEAAGPEPSLRALVLNYYQTYFPTDKALELTDRYFAALSDIFN